MPGLFDSIDIDMTRQDIAGDFIEEHRRRVFDQAKDLSIELNRENLRRTARLKFISFGSGSSGNCAYLGDEKAGVLIDAGVEADHVIASLKENAIPLDNIKAIILTHDHSDHVKFAYPLLKQLKRLTLYCTPRAFTGILRRHNISRRIKDYHHPIYKEHPFEVGNMVITAFEVSHDGTDNAGFHVEHPAGTFVLVTDTGVITERADYYLRRANYIVIESNYDDTMLENGPYAEYLKARIRSEHGHLSNADASHYIASIASDSLKYLFLCHLSNDNNTREIATATMSQAIRQTPYTVAEATTGDLTTGDNIRLAALPRQGNSPLFIFRSPAAQQAAQLDK